MFNLGMKLILLAACFISAVSTPANIQAQEPYFADSWTMPRVFNKDYYITPSPMMANILCSVYAVNPNDYSTVYAVRFKFEGYVDNSVVRTIYSNTASLGMGGAALLSATSYHADWYACTSYDVTIEWKPGEYSEWDNGETIRFDSMGGYSSNWYAALNDESSSLEIDQYTNSMLSMGYYFNTPSWSGTDQYKVEFYTVPVTDGVQMNPYVAQETDWFYVTNISNPMAKLTERTNRRSLYIPRSWVTGLSHNSTYAIRVIVKNQQTGVTVSDRIDFVPVYNPDGY